MAIDEMSVGQPFVNPGTTMEMQKRIDWGSLLDAPLPAGEPGVGGAAGWPTPPTR